MDFTSDTVCTDWNTVFPTFPSPPVGTRNSRISFGIDIADIMQPMPITMFIVVVNVAPSMSVIPILHNVICTIVVTKAFTI